MFSGHWLYLWLSLAAFAAALVNSIAGGGTLLSFPALLTAVTPVVANGTSTVALVPGSLAAAWGYRRQLQGSRRWLWLLTPPSIIGGIIGSLLVTCLDPGYFEALVPWLILTAAVLFALQPLLARCVGSDGQGGIKPGAAVACVVFQLFVAIYGGYFGAGIGILMLSSLGLMGMTNINSMNAIKNFLAVFINGTSIIVFAIQGVVDWHFVAVMAPAAALGAYAGAVVALRLNRRLVRWIVICIGFGLAGYFFYQSRS
jgi:uncharacterized membrane protein YfcA